VYTNHPETVLNMTTQTTDFKNIQRILVIKLRHHGDVLLSSPVFQVLKNHHPHLDIDALVYKETAPMLQFHPAINTVHSIDREWKKQGKIYYLKQELGLFKTLKQSKYDLIIHLTEHWRGLSLVKLLKPEYSISGSYYKRRGNFWRKSFTHLYTPSNKQHIVEQNLEALTALGIKINNNERSLILEPGASAREKVHALIEKENIISQKFIHIHPGSRWLFKCWKESHFHAFIKTLIERGEKIVITAAPDKKELQMVERILLGIKANVTDLSGKLNLLELAALSEQAKCYMGVDTAPTHIAAAMQTPVVVLFGPSTESLWGPWQVAAKIITNDTYTCRSCNQDGCEGSKISDCLYTIKPETVLKAMDDLMAETKGVDTF